MDSTNIIATRLVPQCRRICGAVIEGVTCHVFESDATPKDIDVPGFCVGGEVVLSFYDTDDVYVSWEQVDGWCDDAAFSIALGRTTLFSPGSLHPLSANESRIWSPHIGKTVDAVAIYGDNGVPFVLSIRTVSGTVSVGTSYQNRFGDGDDMLTTTDCQAIKWLSQIWLS